MISAQHCMPYWEKKLQGSLQQIQCALKKAGKKITCSGKSERNAFIKVLCLERNGYKYENKELVTANDGFRESKLSWREMLLDLKQRGLSFAPKLATGDGGLGFWVALGEVFPEADRDAGYIKR